MIQKTLTVSFNAFLKKELKNFKHIMGHESQGQLPECVC